MNPPAPLADDANRVLYSPIPSLVPSFRVGLSTKIFLGSAAVVAGVLAITLVIASNSARRAADDSIQHGLEATRARVQDLLTGQADELAAAASVFLENADNRNRIITPKDSGDFLDVTQVAVTSTGGSWAQLVDTNGIRLAKSDEPAAEHLDLSQSGIVRDALNGNPARGFGVSSDSLIFVTIAVPVKGAGGRVHGALMVAKYINDTVAARVGITTGSEVFFYALDRDKHPRIAGLTDGLRRNREQLLAVLSNGMMEAAEPVVPRGAGMMMSAASERHDASIGDEVYVGQGQTLLSANMNPVGGFVAFRSLRAEMAGYYAVRRTILISGALGLLLAVVLAGFLARQITRPVAALAAATQRAAEGDYGAEIPAAGADEIGTLSDAFKRLLTDLKGKQALVEYLSDSSGGRTLPLAAVTPTMQQAMGGATVLEPGRIFAVRYEIKGVLGAGGMGMVYKANDTELGETVAIKTLKPDMIARDSSALDRFKSEIRLARKISHRNVVRTHDLGESGGLYYITMEYVEGKSLKELVRSRGRLPVAAVLPIAKQLTRALEAAHEQGVIHRDIKPQNMVVQADGVLKVMDFGIARLATQTRDQGHTQAGMVVGTPEYMAPEQLLGDELDVRADLYATGVVLYECLTGRMPVEADTPITLITKILEEVPPTPRAVQEDVPVALSDLVMRLLAKEREQRPHTAAELLGALDVLG